MTTLEEVGLESRFYRPDLFSAGPFPLYPAIGFAPVACPPDVEYRTLGFMRAAGSGWHAGEPATPNKTLFNGIGWIANLPLLHGLARSNWMMLLDTAHRYKCAGSNGLARRQMDTQNDDRRSGFIPAIVTLIVAVVGTAGILFSDFGPGNDSHHSGNARMVTAAAVAKAGAIEILSEPPAGRQPERLELAVPFAPGRSA